MSDQAEWPRRILIEVTHVSEYAYIHRGLEEWSETTKPTFGFTTQIEGRSFQKDSSGYWTNEKPAVIEFFEWSERDFHEQRKYHSLNEPVYGWIRSEGDGCDKHIKFVFRVPEAFSSGLLKCLYRSLSIAGAKRSIEVTTRPRRNTSNDFIVGIYYNHPWLLDPNSFRPS